MERFFCLDPVAVCPDLAGAFFVGWDFRGGVVLGSSGVLVFNPNFFSTFWIIFFINPSSKSLQLFLFLQPLQNKRGFIVSTVSIVYAIVLPPERLPCTAAGES